MPPAPGNDPFPAQHFRIEINGLTASSFVSCSGLAAETEVLDYHLGNDKGATRKLPGLHKFGNLTLKRGYTADRQLWDWYKGVLDGAPQRRNLSIILTDETGVDLLRWNVHNAWPAKYEGPTLNASGNEVAMETIELAHEGFELA
jgi:phage tail-like protein